MESGTPSSSHKLRARRHRGSESAFSLLELIVVLLVTIIFATAAVVQLNRVIENYDLTRLTSEVIGQLEMVRAECVKQNDGYPAAALVVRNNVADNAYSTQFYYQSGASIQHVDYNYRSLRNYVLLVSPATVTYTFNPRGKALAYNSGEYTPAAARIAALPVITVQNVRNPNLKRTITLTIAGSVTMN